MPRFWPVVVCGSLWVSQAAGQGPALVSVAPVTEKLNVEAGHDFVATVKPWRRSVVGSAVDGRVTEFPVNAGDAVKAKQPLAQLLTAQIEIQIAAAKADLLLKQEELRELKNGARPEEVREAKAKTAVALSLHDYTQAKLQRTKALFERNAVAEDLLQDDVSKALAASQSYEAAKAAEDLVVAGPRSEKIAQAEARMLMAQEEVNRLEDLLKKHTIVAPFDGFVVAEHTEVGQWIKSGELVAEVEDLSQVEIETQVLENYLGYVRPGVQARIELPALPNRIFVGEVTKVVPRADERSRNFPVQVRLQNEFDAQGLPLVKSGMFARVWLPVERRERVLTAPNDAVVMGGPAPVVFIAERKSPGGAEAVVRPLSVQLGSAFGGAIELSGDGLAAGQELVIEGNERLRPGQEVRIVAASRGNAASGR
jgi:RND family efflux transporter MFP subunit